MSQGDFTDTVSDVDAGDRPVTAFLTERHRHAIQQLGSAFERGRPLAVMVGEGAMAAGFVIRNFIATLDDDVAVIRIERPCADATDLMRKVIDDVGFRPKDMCLDDLEGVFSMFLSYQKSHKNRTVICVERAQDHDLWVLDKLRDLVVAERDEKYGLLVVVSGQEGFKEVLHSGPLSTVTMLAGKRIVLTPFTMEETKAFIRQRLESAGTGIDRLFQYRAIGQIQVLSRGVPDAVAELTNHSLALAEHEGVELVTAELVERANERLEAARQAVPDGSDAAADTVSMNGFKPVAGRLLFHMTGDVVRELAIEKGHTLIGRSLLCDMRVESPIVSRQHALISHKPEGDTLIDLGSTNGTYVDGYRITRHELEPGETITVGDCTIEYIRDEQAPADPDATSVLPRPRVSVN